MNGARQIRGVEIELLQKRGQKFGRLEFREVFPVKIAPVHDAPSAKMEEIHGHQRRLRVPGQHVDVVPLRGGNFLAFFDLGERAQQVAIRRGLLEAFGVGSLHHARFEALHQVVAAALEKQFRVARRFRVFLIRGQSGNARPVAAANVILQAGPRVRARQVHRAGRNAKRFVDEVDDAVREAVREKRPEVNRAVFDQAPRHVHARIFLERRIANVRVGLVVAQQHIEFRLVLLDQAVFERQGFALVVHDDVVDDPRFPAPANRSWHPASAIRGNTISRDCAGNSIFPRTK